MRDYVTEILNEDQGQAQQKDYVGDFIDGAIGKKQSVKVQRSFEETGAISTITGKPIKKFTGGGGPGASYYAHLKSGFVNNPVIKTKIYAADRFPNMPEEERLKRYKYQNGEIIYKDNNGKWYSESSDSFVPKLKRFLGETTAHAPAIVGGTAGEVAAGPVGATAGAMIGEGITQGIGKAIWGDEISATDIVTEGALAGVGSIVGRSLTGTANTGLSRATGGRKGAALRKNLGKDYANIDFKKAASIQKMAKDKWGVDLFDAQTTESRRLINRIKLYGDDPAFSDLVSTAKRMQNEQAENAVNQFFDEIYDIKHGSIDPANVGKEINIAAQDVINGMVKSRKAKANPLYNKAFAQNTKIDITPHLKNLADEIKKWPEGSAERKKLQSFARTLYRTVDKDIVEEKTLSWGGGTITQKVSQKTGTKKVLVPETRIRQLDKIKKTIDKFITPSANEPSITKEVKRTILETKNNILSDLDAANPTYAKARKVWGDDSAAMELLTKKTTLGNIAKLEGNDVINSVKKLFNTTGNSPDTLSRAKFLIEQQNPLAWKKAVRVFLEDKYDSFARSSESGNMGGLFMRFWKQTAGTPKQAKLLKVAMGDQAYKNFEEFTDILRRVSLVEGKESATATRLLTMEQDRSAPREFLKAATRPLYPFRRILVDRFLELQQRGNKKKIIEALLDTRSSKSIDKIKKLGPGTIKGIRAMSTFLSLVIGGEYTRHGSELFKEYKRRDNRH